MVEKLVSIIIPVYNSEKYLRETIESVIKQTYSHWELLLVDDFSIDSSKDIIIEYKNKYSNIYYLKSEKKIKGAAHPRNVGMRNARGEFIAFLDSDDIWHERKLEKQLHCLNKLMCDAICNNGENFPNGFRNKLFRFRSRYLSFEEYLKQSLGIITSSFLAKKKFCNLIGFMDENEVLEVHEDYDYWLRMLKFKENSIYFLNENLIAYRQHENSISNFQTHVLEKKVNQLLYIYNKYPEVKKEKLDFLRDHKQYIGCLNYYTKMYYSNNIGLIELLLNQKIKKEDVLKLWIKKVIMKGMCIFFPSKIVKK